MTDDQNDVFEKQYQEIGLNSQRKYPNESLLVFFGSSFFHLNKVDRKKIKVLEIGCGSGANLWMVAKEGFDAYGIDFSPTGLRYCEEILRKWDVSANISLGDFTQLQFPDNEFDVIFDIGSMQHVNVIQHTQSYKEVYRCLRPGGKIFSYHLGENSISLKSTTEMIDHCTVKNIADNYPLANNGQTCFLSANEVRNMLSSTGFINIKVEKILRSYSNQTSYIEYLSIVAEK